MLMGRSNCALTKLDLDKTALCSVEISSWCCVRLCCWSEPCNARMLLGSHINRIDMRLLCNSLIQIQGFAFKIMAWMQIFGVLSVYLPVFSDIVWKLLLSFHSKQIGNFHIAFIIHNKFDVPVVIITYAAGVFASNFQEFIFLAFVNKMCLDVCGIDDIFLCLLPQLSNLSRIISKINFPQERGQVQGDSLRDVCHIETAAG